VAAGHGAQAGGRTPGRTRVTARPTHDRTGMTLGCDSCGRTLHDIGARLRDWHLVWRLVSEHGWSGSSLPSGPHRCPRCAARQTPDGEGPDRVAGDRWRITVPAGTSVAVVHLSADLDSGVADGLRPVLTDLGRRYRDVVVDLALATFIDSAGLNVLVRTHQEVKRTGGLVCLAAAPRSVVGVLHTMRLHTLFPLFDRWEDAANWLRARTAGSGPDPDPSRG
jgi:anti-sigma B factor antagonist